MGGGGRWILGRNSLLWVDADSVLERVACFVNCGGFDKIAYTPDGIQGELAGRCRQTNGARYATVIVLRSADNDIAQEVTPYLSTVRESQVQLS